MTREEALAPLRAEVQQGRPVIGAGAGTGLSAKLAEAGRRPHQHLQLGATERVARRH